MMGNGKFVKQFGIFILFLLFALIWPSVVQNGSYNVYAYMNDDDATTEITAFSAEDPEDTDILDIIIDTYEGDDPWIKSFAHSGNVEKTDYLAAWHTIPLYMNRINGTADEFIIWKYANITGLAFEAFYYTTSGSQNSFTVETSPDGINWTDISIARPEGVAIEGAWYQFSFYYDALPTNTDFIKISWPAGGVNWTPHLGPVTILCNGATIPVVPPNTYPANRISLVEPYYRDEVQGITTVKFYCPGAEIVSVYTAIPPSVDELTENPLHNGKRETIGVISLVNKNGVDGYGELTFDADLLPSGPISLRIRAATSSNADLDNAYVQFYNLGGIKYSGLDTAPVNPETIGMNVVFQDDFKEMPVMSRLGRGGDIKYATSKPDTQTGGEYGASHFADYDPGAVTNPFSLTDDEFLKIETKYHGEDVDFGYQRKSTTGFISSMGNDGSGFTTSGGTDQYFEARIFFGPNPGGWPAFWTLTANGYYDNIVSTENYGKRLDPRWSDELDIIEAYFPNYYSFSSTSSPWPKDSALNSLPPNPSYQINTRWFNSPVDIFPQGQSLSPAMSANYPYLRPGDPWQPNILENQDVEEAFKNLNLGLGFHTYGLLIREDWTYYYYDNVEIVKTPTLASSYEMGNYWMINGGTTGSYSGYNQTFGFNRYGESSDLYVDWVRVYEAAPAGLSAIEVVKLPAKVIYNQGDTAFDLTDLVVRTIEDAGNIDIDISPSMLSGFDTRTPGVKIITINYKGFTDTFEIQVMAASYTVTYDANGGAGTMIDAYNPYIGGSLVTVRGNDFDVTPDRLFISWNTSADGNGINYNPGDTFNISGGNVVLYAQWKILYADNMIIDRFMPYDDAYAKIYEKTNRVIQDNGWIYYSVFGGRYDNSLRRSGSIGPEFVTWHYDDITKFVAHTAYRPDYGSDADFSFSVSADGVNWTTVTPEIADRVLADTSEFWYTRIYTLDNLSDVNFVMMNWPDDSAFASQFDWTPHITEVYITLRSELVLENAETSAKNFISIKETSKNSRAWVLKFNVVETYSDGSKEVVTYSINLNGNNANLDGKYIFTDSPLEGYTLVYDIKGNGSNIKTFNLIKP